MRKGVLIFSRYETTLFYTEGPTTRLCSKSFGARFVEDRAYSSWTHRYVSGCFGWTGWFINRWTE